MIKASRPQKPTRQTFVQYTADAMSRKVQGCVVIQVVVEADGKVRRYRVSHSLEESLDLASTEALQEWEFVPGTLHGTPRNRNQEPGTRNQEPRESPRLSHPCGFNRSQLIASGATASLCDNAIADA